VANVAARLTDKRRKQIITDRAAGLSLRQLAEKYGTSKTTVQRVLARDPETVRKVTAKKEANTLEMLQYMDAQKGKAQELLSKIIDALGDPDKLARANVRDLATAYGIIADKFIQTAPTGGEDLLARAREMLGGIDGVIK
jgi:IS30 family transposase